MANNKTNTWETGLLELLFNNTDFTGVGDAGGLLQSAAAGDLFISLHTADPGEAGTQLTNEVDTAVAYTSYARQAVPRSVAGWTVATNNAKNAAIITFPTHAGTGTTATHFGIGTALSGAGKLLYHAPLTSSLVISVGLIPQFPINALVVTEE